jgi:UDP-GlcNAc3NAcA epimerase
MRILTVVGARPQFIKAAALSRAIRGPFAGRIEEHILHTGQHYDQGMSDVFFAEMGIPQPAFRLNIGSSSHGEQTGRMLEGIEKVCLELKPDAIVVYGDTNSTLAGALAGVKLHIPVVHIEAGLRSHNKRMPEEVNRIMADHSSTLLYTPTGTGATNLLHEGFLSLDDAQAKGRCDLDNPYVVRCGDLMYDNTLHYGTEAERHMPLLGRLGLSGTPYLLATIHRPQNTDDPATLLGILGALRECAIQSGQRVVIPMHPRTSNILRERMGQDWAALQADAAMCIIDPVGFLEMLLLQRHASMVLTDSGGVQKEAYFMQKPCVILRPETEWKEIVGAGCAMLAGSDPQQIVSAFSIMRSKAGTLSYPPIFGDGHAAEHICATMLEFLSLN